jgi:hypothetical protein
MKNFALVLVLAATAACNVGCATLKNQGVIDDGQKTAACTDIATACSAATLVNADENVRLACAALAAFCVAPL